ncbi:hypothetical protein EUGRSUZ_H03746 [Eucalyptus grandis]|uniref:Uncharacterized protein n=2 Tax=Eucalyptus grandis TaxID=71139 RepID=A0ACC3JVJ1_EUCGR|nr:hypothetical protein EUGRSUZ_H03746 [Eucalyptus grandis]
MEGSIETQHTYKNDGIAGSAYEVFLSFRGEDTRIGFTSFLYTSMIDAGIRVYKDAKELRKGEKFGPELLQAINQSKISIPIFSKGYASSVWCLKELVQMDECQKTRGQKIMPIFYDVAPLEVRHQPKGTGYGDAFFLHKEKNRYDEETMRQWKDALNAVAAISGWDLHTKTNRDEGEIVKIITHKVFNELKKAYLAVSNNLVGVDHHVHEIMEKIGAHTSETRIIGIHGMGGVGKTTIAKIIYNELSNKYDNCCFLSDIRDTSKRKGIEYLQQQLIRDILKIQQVIRNIDEGKEIIKERLRIKKVLLLLDDVEENEHMDALVGKRDWFGEGSKLIVTTRRKDVLDVWEVDWRYELTCLNSYQSLQLFRKYAFRGESLTNNYISQSMRAVHIAGGLPLAIMVIGSLLSNKNKEEWDDTLNTLESVPDGKVQDKLKISYDALNDLQKRILLDIACHFIGCCKDIVVYFWDAPKPFLKAALEVLQNMSLIKIGEDNILWMHDQLRDLGRAIVCQERGMNMEKPHRVWNPEEGLNLMKIHKENSNLLPQLRWLSWHNICPTFEITNFSMENVIVLDLSQSQITNDWKGWSHMKVIKNLKVLNLAHCQHLKRIPNFSAHSNLEHLILSGCESLIEIDGSICQLKRLIFLDVSNCWNLQRLPETVGNWDSLTKLDISHTSIEEVPDSIGMLKNLKVMKMQNGFEKRTNNDACKKMGKVKGMEIADRYNHVTHAHAISGYCLYGGPWEEILGWPGVHALPRFPESLIELVVEELRVDTFPDLSNLANLKVLHLGFGPPNCDGKSDGLLEKRIPRWIGNLSKLESLLLRFFGGTASSTDLSLPPHPPLLLRLPSSLSVLCLSGCDSLCSMDLSNLRKLSSLDICCSTVAKIEGLGCLENLRDFRLWHVVQLVMLPDLSKLNTLRHIEVIDCGNLVEIQGELPRFLDKLKICSCDSLQEFPDPFSIMGKTHVYVYVRIGNQSFEYLSGDRFQLSGFKQMQIPDLSNMDGITLLRVESCHNLVEIQGELPQSLKTLDIDSCKSLVEIQNELPQSLETLRIQQCESLQKLPEMSSLKRLRKVTIKGLNIQIPDLSNMDGIRSFIEIQGKLPQSFKTLWIQWCGSLQKLPELSSLKRLQEVTIKGLNIQIPDLSNSDEIRYLSVRDCHNLVEIQGELPQSFEYLNIESCGNLVEIQGELPQSLEELEIIECGSLQKLPELSSLKRLREVTIKGLNIQILDLSNLDGITDLSVEDCHNLVEIQGELPQSLEKLWIDSCESLQKLPELSSLKRLREVTIKGLNIQIPDLSNMDGIRYLSTARGHNKRMQEIRCGGNFLLCLEKSIEFVGEDEEDEFVEEDNEEEKFVEEYDEEDDE